MKTTYRNTFTDLLAFQWDHTSRSVRFQIIILFFVVFTSLTILRAIPHETSLLVKIITLVIMEAGFLVIFLLVLGLLTSLAMISKMNRTFLTDHTISIAADGLTEETIFNRSEYKWAGIQKILRTKRHLYVYVSQHGAHVIPRRAFASPADWDDFCKAMVEFKASNAAYGQIGSGLDVCH